MNIDIERKEDRHMGKKDKYKDSKDNKDNKDNKDRFKKSKEKYLKKDELADLIQYEIEKAFKHLVINVEVNPEINVINDTQREVAIGKKGVGAGENTNIGIVGKDGSAAAGSNPDVATVGKDGTAQAADSSSSQAASRGNAASEPQDRFNQGTESDQGDLNQEANQ
jgi:hypothetical protein